MPWEFRKTVLRLSARSGRLCPVFADFQGTNKTIPALADVSEDTGGGEKEDGTWTVTTGISVKETGS